MQPDRKPWWHQATALVTVTTGGAIAGFTFVPGAAATMTSPSSVPLHLLALDHAARSGDGANARAFAADGPGRAASDALLRSAIVNVATYYLQLAKTRTPAQMESLIWDNTSLDNADHGPSCAAFASLTLELAAQAVGQRSWASGGSTYPWPVADWADVRVNQNPASPAVTSIVQDATAHQRWHPLGDGYAPQPGDWVVFDGHVEIVTGYAGGTLDTIGADSLPGLTVNAHSFHGRLGDDGVQGFVDNGNLPPAPPAAAASTGTAAGTGTAARTGTAASTSTGIGTGVESGPSPAPRADTVWTDAHGAQVPGVVTPVSTPAPALPANRAQSATAAAAEPAAAPAAASPAPAAATSAGSTAGPSAAAPSAAPEHYRKYAPPSPAPAPGTRAQQGFINLIAPGAMAAQQRFGVPAAVTIAQAIEESAWGHSGLAARDHNLFGIKGTGTAGSVTLPTAEYLNGQWVSENAAFRTYHNVAESIADHAELLATSHYYQRAMADRAMPDAFANDLTGVYATDPEYGANLIALMKLYNLYRFDSPATATPSPPPTAAATVAPATDGPSPARPIPASPAPAVHPQASQAHPASPAATAGHAAIPGLSKPVLVPANGASPAAATASSATASDAFIPGAVSPGSFGLIPSTSSTAQMPRAAAPAATAATAASFVAPVRGAARVTGVAAHSVARYRAQLPVTVTTAYFATAKAPIMHAEQLYREVAGHAGIRWELLAACDWMQCKSRPRYSPVHGEKIGSLNADGTAYRTKSEALAQCASDLVELAGAVYRIDLTAPRPLSVRALADAFAAFRWGELLRRNRVSAMEFPYSVAGLTQQHVKMHWPPIDEQDAPDRPGSRFREPFGAVPVVLSLEYPATVLTHRKGQVPLCSAS